MACLTLTATLCPSILRAEKWLWLGSEHFDMMSSESEAQSRRMLAKLEQFHAAFSSMSRDTGDYEQRPLAFVFSNAKLFNTYFPKAGVTTIGYYLGGSISQRMAMTNDERRYGYASLYYGYASALVNTRALLAPYYFKVGMAMFLASFEASGNEAAFGGPPPPGLGFVAELVETKLMEWPEFFSVRASDNYGNDAWRRRFNAQAWLLRHYAMFGNKTGPVTSANLYKFMKLCQWRGANMQDVFYACFGINYGKLDSLLYNYLHDGRFKTLSVQVPLQPIREKITCREATEFECAAYLAGLHLDPKSNDTQTYQNQLLKLAGANPANPIPYEILANFEISRKDGQKLAEEYCRNAVERNTTNPMVYIWLLRNSPRLWQANYNDLMTEQESADARKLVDRALELAPNSQDAHECLAIIEAHSPTMRAAAVKQVRDIFPKMQDPNRMLTALGIMDWRNKDYDGATDAMDALLSSALIPDAVRKQAEQFKADIQKAKAAGK